MAAKIFGGVIACNGAAQNVATALGLVADASVGMTSNFSLQAASTNGSIVYIGDSALAGAANAMVELAAGQSLGEMLNTKYLNLSNLYVFGAGGTSIRVMAVQ